MPGKSKKGGGLESSPAYKKSPLYNHKSPMMKALVGKQHNLPEELKTKILASPAKKYKSDAQRKAVHASKAEQSPAKMYGKKSPAKNYKNPQDYKVFNMGNEASPPFKLRSGNTTPFKQRGSSPLKQSYPSSAQKGPHGPKGTLDEVKRIASKKAAEATKAANAKKYGMQSLNKAINKRLKPDPQLTFKKKLSTPKVSKKKIAKKVAGKIGSKLIPGIGTATLAHDVYKVGKKMKGGHSFTEALKSHYLGIEKK